MGREIKFRAWNSKTKQMIHEIPLKVLYPSSDVVPDWTINNLYNDQSVMRWMQYTGLKDKNGVEICEGDIVRVQHPNDKTKLPNGRTVYGDFANTIGRVFWWDEEGGWYHGNNAGRPPKRMWEHCEIIGNIYEHPELLDG